MQKLFRRRPSAPMVISIVALVFATSGTAVAMTKLVSGDKLIAKRSLSGNRLENHTITAKQINKSKLGTVPSATDAGYASSAGIAGDATNATNAANANNANTVGGDPASAFEPASSFIQTGLVTTTPGNTVTLPSFGPFTLTLACRYNGGTNYTADVDVTSTAANSATGEYELTPGTPYQEPSLDTGSSGFAASGVQGIAFIAPGQAFLAQIDDGVQLPGVSDPCYAVGVISRG